MKKVFSVMMVSMLLMMAGGINVCADVGIPTGPEYNVVLSIYGAAYYNSYDEFLAGKAAGTLAGGQTFYVWADYYDGALLGTTNAKASSEQYESLIFIENGGFENATEMIGPEAGSKNETTVIAVTTDALNLRYGPGTGFKVIKTLDKDTEVTYDYTFNSDTAWMYVNASGRTGWVCGDYLKQKGVVEKEAKPEESEDSSELTPAPQQESTGSLQESEAPSGKSKKRIVAGIICICAGVAVLITVLAAYLLNRRQQGTKPR